MLVFQENNRLEHQLQDLQEQLRTVGLVCGLNIKNDSRPLSENLCY